MKSAIALACIALQLLLLAAPRPQSVEGGAPACALQDASCPDAPDGERGERTTLDADPALPATVPMVAMADAVAAEPLPAAPSPAPADPLAPQPPPPRA